MSSPLTIDASAIQRLAESFGSQAVKNEINSIPQRKAIAALVAQAIADNFNQEGPGWAPLKASTIRRSVSKKIAEKLAKMSDSELLAYEAKHRKAPDTGKEQPARRILRRTGLLMKSVTTPGAKGNLYRVDGTNLVWGTDLVYAAVHNYGDPKKNIPQREFLKIRKEWQDKINDYIINEALKIIQAKIIEANK